MDAYKKMIDELHDDVAALSSRLDDGRDDARQREYLMEVLASYQSLLLKLEAFSNKLAGALDRGNRRIM